MYETSYQQVRLNENGVVQPKHALVCKHDFDHGSPKSADAHQYIVLGSKLASAETTTKEMQLWV